MGSQLPAKNYNSIGGGGGWGEGTRSFLAVLSKGTLMKTHLHLYTLLNSVCWL